MKLTTFSPPLLLIGLSATACITPEDPVLPDETTSVDIAEIHGNELPATAFQLARAVKVPGCTGTRISPRHVLTAAHCGSVTPGRSVRFYTNGPGYSSFTGVIEAVATPPGLNDAACQADGSCEDHNGNFADMAIVTLSADSANENELAGEQATLAWRYPGDGVGGYKVGAGGHDGGSNANGLLLRVYDTTDDSDDSGGYFVTSLQDTDDGDSGGPFYVNNKIVGTLWGRSWDIGDGYYAKYTSVPYRLEWILDVIGFKWQGQPPQANTSLTGGTTIETLIGSHQKCQYACEKTSNCEGYNYTASVDVCHLLDSVDGTSSLNGITAALKHGSRSGSTGWVTGYVRSDNRNVVVHRRGSVVNELQLGSNWTASTISGNAPSPASKLSGYRRADGTNVVVYRSGTNRIIELARENGQWYAYDLSSTSGAVTPAGSPVGYIGIDGLSAVIYRGTDGHIHELKLGSRGWIATDMTAEAGATLTASSDPSAFTRSDGYSSVTFRSGTGIYELYKTPAGQWTIGGISNLAGSPAAASRPFGYRHHDGFNAVVYRSTANQIVELWLDSTGWHYGILASNADGDPVASVRSDAVDTIVFRSGSQIHQLENTPWHTVNLSSTTGLPTTWLDPTVYVRSDGYNSIVTRVGTSDVAELFYKKGTSWGWANLSTIAGE